VDVRGAEFAKFVQPAARTEQREDDRAVSGLRPVVAGST
jgi:hypothetical protein